MKNWGSQKKHTLPISASKRAQTHDAKRALKKEVEKSVNLILLKLWEHKKYTLKQHLVQKERNNNKQCKITEDETANATTWNNYALNCTNLYVFCYWR